MTSSRMWILAAALIVAVASSVDADVRPWKPAGISSPLFESHAAFDPRTGELYFVRSSPAFEGWRIFVSRCTRARDGPSPSHPSSPAMASKPIRSLPPTAGRLYFISTRSLDGHARKDLDIWRVDRGSSDAWGAPVHLPEPVNSAGSEWFPRPGPDGWLYFGSNRPGGLGGNDIWRARTDASGRWIVGEPRRGREHRG